MGRFDNSVVRTLECCILAVNNSNPKFSNFRFSFIFAGDEQRLGASFAKTSPYFS